MRDSLRAPQATWLFIHQRTEKIDVPLRTGHLTDALTDEEKRRRLEAAIFLSPEGETSRKLAKLAGLADATEARTLIRQINQSLDAHGRAYRIEEVAGGYAMMTRSQFAPWLRRLEYVPGALKLSQSALETLAVVAYRQPVLRANVEAIRGVSCSEVLKQLMELDLVRISGRSEDLGRPYLYGTTRRFLQMFGLRSADRLPRMAWVNQAPATLSPQELLSPQEFADLDSESKESTVKMSFTGAALLERNAHNVDENLLEDPRLVPSAIDDDEDDFDDDDDVDDDEEDDDFDDDDDEEAWDDDDEDLDDDDEADDLEEEDAEWEEVDDEDEEDLEDEDDEEVDDEDEDDEDDWDDDEEDDDDEDWD